MTTERSVCAIACVCAHLLRRVVCCGGRTADVPASPDSLGHRCPPPGWVNGSVSTAPLCGKARHSPTPHCHTHTKTGFQRGSYYDKLLLTSTPDGRIKERNKHKLKMLDRKQAPNIFKSTDLSSCNICTLTKINDKAEEKCTEKWFSLFLDAQTTEPQCYIVLMNDCTEEEPCCEPGSWPSAPRVTLRRKPACVYVCVVCEFACEWVRLRFSHWMTFARKGTDSYRDSGLARPKGGAGWDEGGVRWGGKFDCSSIYAWSSSFSPERMGRKWWSPSVSWWSQSGTWRQNKGLKWRGKLFWRNRWRELHLHIESRTTMLGWKLQMLQVFEGRGELPFRGDGSVRDRCTESEASGVRIKKTLQTGAESQSWGPWLSLYSPSKPGRGNTSANRSLITSAGSHDLISIYRENLAPFHRWWPNG